MANFDPYKPSAGSTDYVVKYDNFITIIEDYASEVEAAREGESTLLENLEQNYIGYTLEANINGDSNTYKCTNRAPAEDAQDYVTWEQAQSIVSGSEDPPTNVTDVGVGSLNANDILVINGAGTAITGRPCSYEQLTLASTNVLANKNYDMNIPSGGRIVNLPDSPSIGTTISFADIQGLITSSNKLTINPSSTPTTARYIMGLVIDIPLEIDAYEYCSFDLVYTGISTFGWTLARFQM